MHSMVDLFLSKLRKNLKNFKNKQITNFFFPGNANLGGNLLFGNSPAQSSPASGPACLAMAGNRHLSPTACGCFVLVLGRKGLIQKFTSTYRFYFILFSFFALQTDFRDFPLLFCSFFIANGGAFRVATNSKQH